jgi:hypothetical protein
MPEIKLEKILITARELCVAAGVDPDQIGEHGKPEWLRFAEAARGLLRERATATDPLALLDMLYQQDHDNRQELALSQATEEAVDPLARLSELYEREMGEQSLDPLASPAGQETLSKFSSAPPEPVRDAHPPLPRDPFADLKAQEDRAEVDESYDASEHQPALGKDVVDRLEKILKTILPE